MLCVFKLIYVVLGISCVVSGFNIAIFSGETAVHVHKSFDLVSVGWIQVYLILAGTMLAALPVFVMMIYADEDREL